MSGYRHRCGRRAAAPRPHREGAMTGSESEFELRRRSAGRRLDRVDRVHRRGLGSAGDRPDRAAPLPHVQLPHRRQGPLPGRPGSGGRAAARPARRGDQRPGGGGLQPPGGALSRRGRDHPVPAAGHGDHGAEQPRPDRPGRGPGLHLRLRGRRPDHPGARPRPARRPARQRRHRGRGRLPLPGAGARRPERDRAPRTRPAGGRAVVRDARLHQEIPRRRGPRSGRWSTGCRRAA